MKITTELLISSSHQKKSKNEIELQFLGRLTHLPLNKKKISKIEGLSDCKKVEVLYLYDNQIAVIENLAFAATTLTHLYLQNNCITSMKGLQPLHNLVKLYLGGNKISVVEGLENMKMLEELHLGSQKTELTFEEKSLKGIQDSLVNLDVSNNLISDNVAEIGALYKLKMLNLSGNNIASLEVLQVLFRGCGAVQHVDLRDNPVCKELSYRKRIVPLIPSLVELDGKEIPANEKQFLQNLTRHPKIGRDD